VDTQVYHPLRVSSKPDNSTFAARPRASISELYSDVSKSFLPSNNLLLSLMNGGSEMRVHVITNQSGQIVAIAHVSSADAEVKIGIRPLAEQKISEVDIPANLHHLDPKERLIAIFRDHQLHADGTHLILKRHK